MVSYDFSKVFQFLPTLWQALPMTLSILFFTTLLGSLFGGLLAWAQVGEDKSFAAISKGYIFTLRCTPPIVLLFLVFYGLPEFLKWWLGLDINNWSKTIFVLLTMILLFAAIVDEVFKAAYQAIPKGQTEAGLSIGLTPSQTFWRIIFPQAFQVALPQYSYFGLPIVHTPEQDNTPVILEADIAKLPFYTYWHTACASDVHRLADDTHVVPLADWEAFCQRLVLTGR